MVVMWGGKNWFRTAYKVYDSLSHRIWSNLERFHIALGRSITSGRNAEILEMHTEKMHLTDTS
jgi:hypothetical protein